MSLKAILDKTAVRIDTLPESELRLASRSKNLSCLECGERLIYKHGEIRIAHFAHYAANPNCDFSNETIEHEETKLFMWKLLKEHNPGMTFDDVEHTKNERRYDVFFRLGTGLEIAVEVQHTVVPTASIEDKLRDATSQNVHVLYALVPGAGYLNRDAKRGNGIIIVKESELFLHKTYYGRVYYAGEGVVASVHFDQATTHVEARSWYNQEGEEQSGGGYDKRLKSRRKIHGVNLSEAVKTRPHVFSVRKNMNDGLLIATLNEGVYWQTRKK